MRRLTLFLLLACAMFCVPGAAEPKATRHTVRDYYLRLPSRYFSESASENLRKRPMVLDIANDYIKTYGEKGQPYLQTALFHYRGAELFGVYAQLKTGDVVNFYRWENGRLRDVTGQMWKVKSRAGDRVYLPRYGTTIIIKDETYLGEEKTRLKMRWNNGRFTK